MPPSSYIATRSVLPSKFASVATTFIRANEKEFGPLMSHCAWVSASVVPARSRTTMRSPRSSCGSYRLAICERPFPLKSPVTL